ncbi:circumsporozoite- and TRAP-related protein [Hepatocystis sp. ex Piliocolobus tephrosceles]|nr:circumsporozoite- and TRAP-related protein [Hepatocystis sp. ex Piliocolobus tephrosceles]
MKHTFALVLFYFAFFLYLNADITNNNKNGFNNNLIQGPKTGLTQTRDNFKSPTTVPCKGDDCYCKDIYDVTVILDESGSIRTVNWKNQVFPFTVKLLEKLNVDTNKVHVGIMLFGTNNRDFIKFGEPESSNKTMLGEKVNKDLSVYTSGGDTYINNAMDRACIR